MAYMVRLGIWGPGSPFRDFTDFLGAVEKRGVGAMEIVAMDMKLRGMYIARQLSFQVQYILYILVYFEEEHGKEKRKYNCIYYKKRYIL